MQKQGAKGFAIGAGAGLAVAGVNAVGAAIGGVIHIGEDMIAAASDLNETMSKSEVVFGSAAAGVAKWGDTSAEAFGLSKQKAIEAAASFGNVFKGLGFASSKSAEMSENLVKLAGDLASFNNIDPTDALEKLRSGLAGESEPLRSVGVFLTEAQVKAKAMELGLVGANGELTEGAKITARYKLILEQTTTAQGDFARTSDGLANSQRKASAELENVQAELGQKMLPAQLAATHATLDLFKGLNLDSDGLSGKVTPDVLSYTKNTLGAAAATELVSRGIHDLTPEALDAARALGLVTDAQVQAELGSRTLNDAARLSASVQSESADASVTDAERIRGAFSSISTAARDMASDGKHYFGNYNATVEAFTTNLERLANEAISGYFDPIIEHDQLMADEARLSAAKRVLASKTASHAEKTDAKATIHELERSTTELRVKLALAGQLSKKEQATLLRDLKSDWAHATGAAKTKIAELIAAIESIPENTYVNVHVNTSLPKPKRHAAGGRYQAGEMRMVGEEGPEIDIPDHSGTIIPNNQLGSTGGSAMGGVNLTINVSAGAWSPGQAEQWARQVTPHIAREFQRQGLIAR